MLWGGSGVPFATPLPPEQNSLRFEFAAPSFQPNAFAEVKIQYRTRLDGFDRGWSGWDDGAQREYSNLPPGKFSFQVQARDSSGREGPETRFDFVLLPPWWRTWWASLGYLVFGAFGVVGAVRWRTRALNHRNERLEKIVQDRTKTLAEQNAELARLHKLELDEKITARLAEEKARLEVLRYQLNPHFLFNSLTSIRSGIPATLGPARTAVDRLAEFCRLTLGARAPDDLGPLNEEIDLLRVYLEIESARWSDYLQVEFEIDPAAQTVRLPRLLLLPLVENALKYGRVTSPDLLRLHLKVRLEHDDVFIDVSNTGHWVAHAGVYGLPSTGIGLDNLRERLRRHYPKTHTFTRMEAEGWVHVQLWLKTRSLPIEEGSPI